MKISVQTRVKRVWVLGLFFLCDLGGIFLTGCSTGEKRETHILHQLLLYNLHVRRPPGVGAESSAVPGEYEYESHPRPNERFDCEPLKTLFSKFDLKAVRNCLNRAQEGELVYQLTRSPSPFLTLQESNPEDRIDCAERLLKQIPVPREIFFQSGQKDDDGEGVRFSCYSSRLSTIESDVLGVRGAMDKVNVKVQLPIRPYLTNDEETLLLLGTWIVGPYFTEHGGQGIPSKIVSSEICNRCMGRESLFLESEPWPPHWPATMTSD